MAEISKPPIGGICLRKKFRYGSVTVNTGLKIGNCLGSCGNHDRAILNTIILLNNENALAIPPKITAFPTALPGITAAGTPFLYLSILSSISFPLSRSLLLPPPLPLLSGEMKAAVGEATGIRTASSCICNAARQGVGAVVSSVGNITDAICYHGRSITHHLGPKLHRDLRF